MIHPRSLLRTDSEGAREFSAPADIVHSEYTLDCGLSNLPCLSRCINLENFAQPKLFLVILSFIGFLQGITLSYFRETSKFWGQHYNISKQNIDWIIYVNEFFVGLLALVVAYWGNRIYRISWIGGLTIFQAVSSLVLIVPEIYKKNSSNYSDEPSLCWDAPRADPGINYVALTVLAVFEIFYSMVYISFFCHGITYLDDNISSNESPAYIGIALASKELGVQAGIYLSWIPAALKADSVFVSGTWLTISILAILAGITISMFPQQLPSVQLLRRISASILDLAAGHHVRKKTEKPDGFFTSLWRLLKNKILMINILCVVFVESAIINFEIFHRNFNQSRFDVMADSYIEVIVNMLKQPLVAVSLIAAGMVIAKSAAHLKSLVIWNIIALILVITLFSSTAFLQCEQEMHQDYKYPTRPHCSSTCGCSLTDFHPICINSRNYISPCYAGCTDKNNSTYLCNCGGFDDMLPNKKFQGKDGPCDADKCDLYWTLSEGNRVITAALLASTLVTNLIINMRCIIIKDKALALGLEATFVGVIPYLPVKAIYGAVADIFCEFPYEGMCSSFNEDFGLFLSSSTIILLFTSIILSVVLYFLIKHQPETENLQENEEQEMQESGSNERPEEHRLMQRPDLRLNNIEERTANSLRSGITNADSLLDMENVGDDHDSVDSIPLNQNHSEGRIYTRGNILQSSF